MTPLLPIFRITATPALRFQPIRGITPLPAAPSNPNLPVQLARRLQQTVLRKVARADSNQMPS
jgi:hypothetical protein